MNENHTVHEYAVLVCAEHANGKKPRDDVVRRMKRGCEVLDCPRQAEVVYLIMGVPSAAELLMAGK